MAQNAANILGMHSGAQAREARFQPKSLAELQQDFQEALTSISVTAASLGPATLALLPRINLLTHGRQARTWGENFFDAKTAQGRNGLEIAVVLVRTEVAASILEVMGGGSFGVLAEFLRDDTQKIRDTIKSATNYFDSDARSTLEGDIKQALLGFGHNSDGFTDTVKRIAGHKREKAAFKAQLARAELNPGGFLDFGLGSIWDMLRY